MYLLHKIGLLRPDLRTDYEEYEKKKFSHQNSISVELYTVFITYMYLSKYNYFLSHFSN